MTRRIILVNYPEEQEWKVTKFGKYENTRVQVEQEVMDEIHRRFPEARAILESGKMAKIVSNDLVVKEGGRYLATDHIKIQRRCPLYVFIVWPQDSDVWRADQMPPRQPSCTVHIPLSHKKDDEESEALGETSGAPIGDDDAREEEEPRPRRSTRRIRPITYDEDDEEDEETQELGRGHRRRHSTPKIVGKKGKGKQVPQSVGSNNDKDGHANGGVKADETDEEPPRKVQKSAEAKKNPLSEVESEDELEDDMEADLKLSSKPKVRGRPRKTPGSAKKVDDAKKESAATNTAEANGGASTSENAAPEKQEEIPTEIPTSKKTDSAVVEEADGPKSNGADTKKEPVASIAPAPEQDQEDVPANTVQEQVPHMQEQEVPAMEQQLPIVPVHVPPMQQQVPPIQEQIPRMNFPMWPNGPNDLSRNIYANPAPPAHPIQPQPGPIGAGGPIMNGTGTWNPTNGPQATVDLIKHTQHRLSMAMNAVMPRGRPPGAPNQQMPNPPAPAAHPGVYAMYPQLNQYPYRQYPAPYMEAPRAVAPQAMYGGMPYPTNGYAMANGAPMHLYHPYPTVGMNGNGTGALNANVMNGGANHGGGNQPMNGYGAYNPYNAVNGGGAPYPYQIQGAGVNGAAPEPNTNPDTSGVIRGAQDLLFQ